MDGDIGYYVRFWIFTNENEKKNYEFNIYSLCFFFLLLDKITSMRVKITRLRNNIHFSPNGCWLILLFILVKEQFLVVYSISAKTSL